MSYSKRSIHKRKLTGRRKRGNTRRKRGGDSIQDKHRAEQISHGRKKMEKNMEMAEKNKALGLYTDVEREGPNSYFAVNGLEISPKERQQLLRERKTTYVDMPAFNKASFIDPMTYAEMEEDGLVFGGKKRRTIRKNKRGRKSKRGRDKIKKNI